LAKEVFNKYQAGETPLYKQGSGWTKWTPSAKEELLLEWLPDLTKRRRLRGLPRPYFPCRLSTMVPTPICCPFIMTG